MNNLYICITVIMVSIIVAITIYKCTKIVLDDTRYDDEIHYLEKRVDLLEDNIKSMRNQGE